jgi:copper chaperone
MTGTYKVDGMTCEGCVRSLTRAMADKLPGATVEVDLARGHLTVTGDASEDQIRTAVERAGFTFAGPATAR